MKESEEKAKARLLKVFPNAYKPAVLDQPEEWTTEELREDIAEIEALRDLGRI